MNSNHSSDKAKLRGLRVSIRTLAIIVALVCCYAACWGPTSVSGVKHVARILDEPGTLATESALVNRFGGRILDVTVPFVVRADRLRGEREYYFWFFGYVAKLPWERKVEFPYDWYGNHVSSGETKGGLQSQSQSD